MPQQIINYESIMDSIKNDSQRQSVQTDEGKGYNGWVNYETWLVNLWLTNDYNDYLFFKELVEEYSDLVDASNALKEYVEESNPLIEENSMYTDLLGGALRAVCWYEIVAHFKDE
jgi:hypothetical protein